MSDDELEKIEIERNRKKAYDYDDSDANFTNKTYTDKSTSSNFNNIFKMGENLLKKKQNINKTEQNKRALNGDINIVNRETTLSTTSSLSSNHMKAKIDKDESGKSTNTDSLLKKFSFLKKDKTYLSKLSSYVNKNLHTTDTKKATSRNNTGMVFTKVDLTIDEEENYCQKPTHTSAAMINQTSKLLNEKRVYLIKLIKNTIFYKFFV